MTETPNYHLTQWSKTDRIRMDDFNADNAKIDEVLGQHAAAIAIHGNCGIELTSYTGTGTYGENTPNAITFHHLPLALLIAGEDTHSTLVCRDIKKYRFTQGSTFKVNFTWEGCTVRWWSDNAISQFNTRDAAYVICALYSMEQQ